MNVRFPSWLLVVPAVGMLGTLPAQAMGGFSCKIDDDRVTLALASSISGSDGRFMDTTATLAIQDAGAPKAFRRQELNDAALVHSWFDGRELRVELYGEQATEPPGSMRLDISTKRFDEGDYRGTYSLSMFFVASATDADWTTVEINGEATCDVGD